MRCTPPSRMVVTSRCPSTRTTSAMALIRMKIQEFSSKLPRPGLSPRPEWRTRGDRGASICRSVISRAPEQLPGGMLEQEVRARHHHRDPDGQHADEQLLVVLRPDRPEVDQHDPDPVERVVDDGAD